MTTYVNHADLPVGTPVHVEFDGEIISDRGNEANRNHIVVSDGIFVHHLHRNSPNIIVKPKPRPTVELGQVWHAGGMNFLAYHIPEYQDDADNIDCWLIPAKPGNVDIYISNQEFFEKYPDAILILNPDGPESLGY